MKNKIGVTISLSVVVLFLALFFYLNEKEQQQVVKVVEPERSSKIEPASSTSSSTDFQAENLSVGKVSENLPKIADLVKLFNDFNIGYSSDYEAIVSGLKEYNVSVDPDMETPYGEFEYTDGLVFVSVVEEYAAREEGRDYLLTFVTKTAVSENFNGHNARYRVAKELRRVVKSDKYTGQSREVVYRLKVSSDGLSGVLTLESGKWW